MGSRTPIGGQASYLSLSDPAWSAFVTGCSEATPFHHPAWAGAIARSYRLEAGGLALRDEAGEIEAALPIVSLGRRASRRRWVSLPFTDHCPPIAAEGVGTEEIAERVASARHAFGLASIEIRDGLTGAGHQLPCGYRHTLELEPDAEAVSAGFSNSRVKRKLRRAEREGLVARRSAGARDLLEAFYPLHVATRRRLGVPVQPRRFFAVLGRDLLDRGLGFTVTAYAGDAPVSSAVFLGWNRRLIYKFSASSREQGDVGAAQLVVAEAIRWGCENGYTSFDFGRTEADHEGLRNFKLSWGSTEHDLTYTHLSDRPPRPGGGRAEMILGRVIRASPELVTRAVGRAAYRYTA